MNESNNHTRGWLDSVRNIGDSVLGLARTRFELLAVEVQEEELRLVSQVAWFCVAMTLGANGLLIGLGVLAFWLWDKTGYIGPVLLAIVPLSLAGAILLWLRRQIKNGGQPFASTITEFRKDAECLKRE